MRAWELEHPYNAAHCVELEGAIDVAAVRSAIEGAVRAAGIGELRLDPDRDRLGYAPLRAIPFRVVEHEGARERLLQLLANELNAPFSKQPAHPIRWTLLRDPQHGSCLIAGYRHVAADGSSMERLLADVLARLAAARGRTEFAAPPLSPAVPASAASLDRRLRRHDPLRRLRRVARLIVALRCAHKMPDERDGGNETEVAHRRLSAELVDRCRAAAEAAGAGLNDVFLAAVVAGIAEITPDRHTSRRRRRIAVGTVMSLRSALEEREAPPAFFGVCLTDLVLVSRSPDAPAHEVLAELAAQTREAKTERLAVAGVSAMRHWMYRRLWPVLGLPQTRRTCRKLHPLCAGVTTMEIREMNAAAGALVRSYIRACPPGPGTPLVFAPTLHANGGELTLVYRRACLTGPRAEDLMGRVLEQLESICSVARRPSDQRASRPLDTSRHHP